MRNIFNDFHPALNEFYLEASDPLYPETSEIRVPHTEEDAMGADYTTLSLNLSVTVTVTVTQP